MSYIVPLLVLFIVGYGLFKRVRVYDAFLKGAKEGLRTAVNILPSMAAMLTAIALLNVSGLLPALTSLLAPVFTLIGIPGEAAPLMLMRPFSGSASLALLNNILDLNGPDSRAGLVASALMGSTETIFYTLSVYLAAAKVKKSRYAVPAALIAWILGGAAAGLWFR